MTVEPSFLYAIVRYRYYYDADGNVSKKVLADGSYVVYHYSDGTLEYEEHFNASNVLQELLKYSYDADGNVEYLLYKDNYFSNANAYDLYYYVRDAVGNITDLFQIREQSGSSTTVVNRIAAHYEYDPYGNILSVDKYNNDNIGDINPIRYKDYYYDLQTGWYQLCSRFYDPEVGRFLNADDLSLITETDSGVIDKNLYSYCDGNPVMRKDNGGDCWVIVAPLFVVPGVGEVLMLSAMVVIAAYSVYETYQAYNNVYNAKGGNQNYRDTSLRGKSNEEIEKTLKNPNTPKSYKEKLKKEQKVRKTRNSQSKSSKYSKSRSKSTGKAKR